MSPAEGRMDILVPRGNAAVNMDTGTSENVIASQDA